MKLSGIFCAAGILSVMSLSAAHATENDESAALHDLAARFFAAARSGDADDWRKLQLAEGTTLSFRQKPDAAPGELLLRMARNEDFIAGIEDDGHDYVERWTSEPIILVRGPIAVIWGEYEFLIDGEFSHCGVDSIDAVKVDGEWKIANAMWTVEKEGCSPTALPH